ncbi:MAG TPA: DegT/DnrJ/EryC1/StrS family aminotransferase [Abditibacteriaceae bacterium]|nr:DegT/DnrJ/EryC1/StrS family aminotransferase [Abditibacteriaceae bacterium]
MASGNDEKLALDGGTPVRSWPFTNWPIWDEQEEAALLRVLRSGRWGWEGDETQNFEDEFARAHQARFAFTVASGSAALETALAAAGVTWGDEVIVPPYTFFATASACLMRGAIPVFADIDGASLNLDAAAVEAAITPRTKAIIPVHIGGCPANLDAIIGVARRHNLSVIEDAAQAHGAAWRGRPVGAIGNLGCFSFQSSKNINSGEGGAVLTDDEELAERCWSFKNYGRERHNTVWYGHTTLGTNFRLTEFQAALLRAQLTHLEDWAQRRTRNGEHLSAGLGESGVLMPQQPDAGVTRHAYHVFMACYDSQSCGGRTRDWFCEAMSAEGISCVGGYTPLYLLPGIRQGTQDLLRALGRDVSEDALGWTRCPVVEEVCRDAVWILGQSAFLGTTEDMDDILRAVAKVRRGAEIEGG